MSFAFAGTITGAPAGSYLTTPTFTTTADTAPSSNGKQVAITALGGTQTGVSSHTTSVPFVLAFYKPRVVKGLPAAVNGVYRQIPMNAYKQITIKGVSVALGVLKNCVITTTISVPAGSETYDVNSIASALSAHIGQLYTNSATVIDTAKTGIM